MKESFIFSNSLMNFQICSYKNLTKFFKFKLVYLINQKKL